MRERQGFATGPVLAPALLAAALLLAFAGGYGYHRDELYFLVAGRHLAWAYADQGVLTPLIARAADALAPGSLTVLRAPSALMSAGVVVLTGACCRELGGGRRAQATAAACMAASSVLLAVGHLLSTTTFDLLAWTAVTWLGVRALAVGDDRLWLAAGVVAGIALLDKPLIAFLLVALAAGAALTGPRRLLRSPWAWGGATAALALWSPWLAWQAAHGWPQLDVSSSIASGGSASSQPRWALLPFQLLLAGPLLAPVWVAGLLALARRPALRPFRLFAAAWAVLVVVFVAAGGKPYYLAGMLGLLIAAGAIEVDRRLRRRWVLWAAVVLTAVPSAVVALPIVPARHTAAIVGVDPDLGETIGWPDLVRDVARAARGAAGRPVIFTSNYGEAGAIDRYGPALGLPAAYSGHNAFADWGPPPDRAAPVVAVGLSPRELAPHFRGCRVRARVANRAGVDNDERGEPIAVCVGPRGPWAPLWPHLRHLG